MSADIGQVVQIRPRLTCPYCHEVVVQEYDEKPTARQRAVRLFGELVQFSCFLMVGFLAAIGFLTVGTVMVFHGGLSSLFN